MSSSSSATTDVGDTLWHDDGEDAHGTDAARSGFLRPSETLGRYVVLYRLGTGGMGVVYAAYDPELDRKVALKLLRKGSSDPQKRRHAQERLLEEARAMARLTHPNVITVHDVAMIHGRVFMAMEFVDGTTLSAALASGIMPWRKVHDILVRAGRGLAAAHDAGLVHRDFKPDNVMLAKDGRVLVMDFGLARALDADPSSDVHTRPSASRSAISRSLAEAIPISASAAPRRDGKRNDLVGTPAYMAPEQRRGESVDARTDQFSYCVTFNEALYGQRPFQGETPAEIARKMDQGLIPDPPPHTKVPAWVRAVILRGLSPDPEQRWPSMHALLAALEDDPAVRRRRWLVGAGVVAIAGASGFGVHLLAEHRGRVCHHAERHLEAVWDDDRKASVERAFRKSDMPYADAALRAVTTALDDYATQWVDMHRETCEATRLRGEQSDELLDLRMHCLNRRLAELRALVDLFVEADAQVVQAGVGATGKLVPLTVCADLELLKAPLPLPDDPQTRQALQAIETELARAKAHQDGGRYTEALSIAQTVVERAEEAGYAPLLADALLRLGELQFVTGAYTDANETLREALPHAARSKHDDAVARIWTHLVTVVGHGIGDLARGREIADAAAAAVARAGDKPEHRVGLARALGVLHLRQGELEQAQQRFEEAVALQRELPGDGPLLAGMLNNLAVTYIEQNELERGKAHLQEALDILVTTVGTDHPLVATMELNIGSVSMSTGELQDAGRRYRRALSILERSVPAGHPDLARVHSNLAALALQQLDLDEGVDRAERAREAFEISASKHPDRAVATALLSLLERQRGESDRALSMARDAQRLWLEASSETEARYAIVLMAVGLGELDNGDLDAAADTLEQALGLWKPRGANVHWERPAMRFALARAIEAAQPDRARALAEEALDELQRAPVAPLRDRELDEIRTWMSAHANR